MQITFPELELSGWGRDPRFLCIAQAAASRATVYGAEVEGIRGHCGYDPSDDDTIRAACVVVKVGDKARDVQFCRPDSAGPIKFTDAVETLEAAIIKAIAT